MHIGSMKWAENDASLQEVVQMKETHQCELKSVLQELNPIICA